MNENDIIDKSVNESTTNATQKTSKSKSSKSNWLLSVVNGEFLTKEFVLNNLSFIFYLILMLLILVAKGYYGKQLTKNVDESQKELNEILGDYVAKKALLEEKTRRIQLVDDLGPTGLKETVNPTKVIRLNKENE